MPAGNDDAGANDNEQEEKEPEKTSEEKRPGITPIEKLFQEVMGREMDPEERAALLKEPKPPEKKSE